MSAATCSSAASTPRGASRARRPPKQSRVVGARPAKRVRARSRQPRRGRPRGPAPPCCNACSGVSRAEWANRIPLIRLLSLCARVEEKNARSSQPEAAPLRHADAALSYPTASLTVGFQLTAVAAAQQGCVSAVISRIPWRYRKGNAPCAPHQASDEPAPAGRL